MWTTTCHCRVDRLWRKMHCLDMIFVFNDYSRDMSFLSRQKLESMSTPELIKISCEYGIDFPDDLERSFIIEELLDAQEENTPPADPTDGMLIEDESTDDEDVVKEVLPKEKRVRKSAKSERKSKLLRGELPLSYNKNTIDAVLRNPAWLFVFWDVKQAVIESLSSDPAFQSLFLHVSFFDSPEDEVPEDFFDLKTALCPGERYVMVVAGKRFVKVDLAASFADREPDLYASTRIIEIPRENDAVYTAIPGQKTAFAPLVELSGIKHILHDDFLNRRQSFAD